MISNKVASAGVGRVTPTRQRERGQGAQEDGDPTPRIVLEGVDTLFVFTTERIQPSFIELLQEAKGHAQVAARHHLADALIELGGVSFKVNANGARNAPFLLSSEYLALKFQPAPLGEMPTVTVELRAILLWQRGPGAALSMAAEILRPLLVEAPVSPLDMFKVSRIDLAVDFQGFVPLQSDKYVTRATSRATYERGTRLTGRAFGRTPKMARLYDKTEEIGISNKGELSASVRG